MSNAPPWDLDATHTAEWLESNWVKQGETNIEERLRRRQFVQSLAGTDGYELLTACTTEVSIVPFVRLSHTKGGTKIPAKAQDLAEQLTAFLSCELASRFTTNWPVFRQMSSSHHCLIMSTWNS